MSKVQLKKTAGSDDTTKAIQELVSKLRKVLATDNFLEDLRGIIEISLDDAQLLEGPAGRQFYKADDLVDRATELLTLAASEFNRIIGMLPR